MAKESSRRLGLKSLAAAALMLANPAIGADTQSNGLWVVSLRPILQARMDPLMVPGKIGGHVHNILGASNFRVDLNTPDEQQNAGCSTAPLQADKSSYWTPALYFINPDGKYEPIPSNHNRAYYKIHGRNVQPFPKGFRMIVGTGISRFAGDTRMRTIQMDCGHVQGPTPKNEGAVPGSGLPNGDSHQSCRTLHVEIEFPSCGWANQSLDSHDHFSHMAWPVKAGSDYGWQDPWTANECPESHPIRYPHIHLQTNYDLSPEQQKNWRGTPGAQNLIFANGDTVGQSFHADFVNGWDETVLTNAIAQCGGTNGGLTVGDKLDACPAFQGHLDGDLGNNCRYQGTIPAEEIGYFTPLDELPGCNPRWDEAQGDEKPNTCPWHTGEPQYAIPTHMYQEFGRENGYAVVAPKLADGTYAPPVGGEKPFVTPWGVDHKMRFAKFGNPVLTLDNVVQAQAPASFATGLGTVNFAVNMNDPSVYEDVGGLQSLPESMWANIANPKNFDFARLPKQYDAALPTKPAVAAPVATPPAAAPPAAAPPDAAPPPAAAANDQAPANELPAGGGDGGGGAAEPAAPAPPPPPPVNDEAAAWNAAHVAAPAAPAPASEEPAALIAPPQVVSQPPVPQSSAAPAAEEPAAEEPVVEEPALPGSPPQAVGTPLVNTPPPEGEAAAPEVAPSDAPDALPALTALPAEGSQPAPAAPATEVEVPASEAPVDSGLPATDGALPATDTVLPATDAALPATGNVLPAGRKCIRHRRRSRDKRVHRGSF